MSTNNATADQLKFTSMNAMVEGSGVTVTQKATWSIASPGGTEADYEILYSDNTSTVKATKLTNTKSLTLQLLQPGEYTFTITLPYTMGGVNYTATRTVKMVAMDCTIRTCNGGNAVMPGFSENFGTMANGVSRRPYPINGIVTYTYQGSGDLIDNNYTISNTTKGKSNWADVGDHTGDYRGAMLVANSAYQPSIFYQKTVTGLCKGSVYNFSAWLMNVNLENSIGSVCKSGYQYAGVTFRVVNAANQSQILAEYRTYSVSMRLDQASLNSWQKYGGSFTVPANIDSVKVYIVNNKPGGCGNDIAVDDIEFSYCSPIITAGIDGNGSSLKEVLCEGAPVTLTSSYQPASYFVAPTYQWEMSDDNGITWMNVPYGTATGSDLVIAPGELRGTRTVAADYLFRIRIYESGSDVSTCAAPSSPVKLTILPMPTLYLTKSQVCAGTTVQLQASGGFDRYAWKDLPGYTGTTRDILVTEDTSITVYGFMDYGDGHTCMDENTKKILKVDAPAVELSSSSVSVCRTEQVELRVNAQLAGNTIRWFKGPDPVTGIRTPIAGTDDQTTISVQPMTLADTLYTVEVTDPTGTCVVTSAPYKVKVTEIPTAQVGANQVMCASFNESGSFTMDATLQPATSGRWTIQNIYGPGVSTTGTVNFDDYVMIANAANPRSK
ncbi:MAG TPA: hypothetical protein VJ720_06300, partial [Chitinophaga sp.]|nr:hypothetical protein [Chitinophaga sp.]